MSKSNYKNYDDFNFDNGPEFENLDKNILDKIELSLAFIFTIFSLFLVAALFDYGGEIGNNLFELLTSSIGIFTYLIPLLALFLAYVFYYKKYKLIIHKVSLLLILFSASIFLLFGTLNLSGDIGRSTTSQISSMIGETFLIILTLLTSFISFISILNMEKETLTFMKKSISKVIYLIKKALLNILSSIKNIFSHLMNSRKNKISNDTVANLAIDQSIPEKREDKESFMKKLFGKMFSFKKSGRTIKVKHGDDLDEIELDEEEMKNEEFTKKYEIEKDEEGNEYIIPKKSRNVHEELLEAASVKLSKEEREKIKVKKIFKKEKEDELKIHEYPEDKPKNKKIVETIPEMDEDYTEEKYEPAPLNLYEEDKGKPSAGDNKANAQTIKRTLQNFQISVEMDEVSVGPTVTRYTLKPAQGVKLSKIAGLDKNLAMDLSTTSIRIEAPIPGKSLVGIEIPNRVKATLGIGTLFGNPIMQEESHPLLVALGKDLHGKPVLAPLSKMPHLLIAGTTGSGKSSTIHALIHSLLYKNSPNNLKFIMIDPKKVELSLYSKLPHLFTPIIKEPKKAVQVLNWLINEMERRYEVLELVGKVNIAGYHNFVKDKGGKYKGNPLEKMPYIVVVIDELADFMMAYPKEMESCIVRLAQKSRAVGIHLVLSTQRPSTNVITGVIKGNIPARIALKVVSQIDSRVILDTNGAEKLLGAGDMLFMNSDGSDIRRIQAPFVSEREIERVVDYLKNKYFDFVPQEISLPQNVNLQQIQGRSIESSDDDGEDLDQRFNEAKDIVISTKIASVTFLQRKMGIGYGRAARLIDLLEQKGIVGPQQTGSKPREVYGENGNPNMQNSSSKNEDELPEDYDVEKDGYLV